jgi:predicted ester cyclase
MDANPTLTQTAHRNRAVVRRVFDEIASNGDFGAVDEVYAPDYVDHAPFPGASPGRDGVRHSIGGLRTALPDLRVTVEDMSAHGDKVAAHNTWRGTHTGEVLGIRPTGRHLEFTGVVVFRLTGGLIAERWAIGLELDLLRELGLSLRWAGTGGARRQPR